MFWGGMAGTRLKPLLALMTANYESYRPLERIEYLSADSVFIPAPLERLDYHY
jgi:hypothetical protein